MKILIAYDGSVCSDAAIMDLKRAGLPRVAEALVLTVAEISPRTVATPYSAVVVGAGIVLPENYDSEAPSGNPKQEAQGLATQAAERLRGDFPGWKVSTEVWVDSPKAAIERKAEGWKPDLIVVGSNGRMGVSRVMLGSVSQHVLHHVKCTVRVSRHHLHPQERAIRLVLGVDGSKCARKAVEEVSRRYWPLGTEVRVVGVTDSRIAIAVAGTTIDGAIPTAIEDESRRQLTAAVHEAVKILMAAKLRATPHLITGIPIDVLLAEAEAWAADCVFVGARGLNVVERALLGSVSTAVSAHAHCSVEVVR
jgi:nucleotide-binding universal stress UspA family protein